MSKEELNKNSLSKLEQDIATVLDNVACLGRDAYGNYNQKMTKYLLDKIKDLI